MPYLRTAFEGGDPDILIRKGVQNRENRKKTVFFFNNDLRLCGLLRIICGEQL